MWLAEEHVVLVCLCVRVFVCSCTECASFSNVDRVELVSCVVFHLSRRPWKVELLTVSMLEIMLAAGEEIDSLDDVDTGMTAWTRRCQFTCETCTEVVRGSADLQEMAATVHAGCYWGMQLEQCRSGGFGPLPELLRIQNRGPSIF